MNITTEDIVLINTVLKSVGDHASAQVKSAKQQLSTDGIKLVDDFLSRLSADAIHQTRSALSETIGKENDTHGEEKTAEDGEGAG